MISLLRGAIARKELGSVVIDVGGVGYGVTVPLSTFYRLPEIGGLAELTIHTHMKDSGIELFGFLSEDEKTVFNLLIGVSGVGPKLATGILSNIEPGEFAAAVASGELQKKKIPGIGPKLASRLQNELKDKVPELSIESSAPAQSSIAGDVISALLNLGYKKNEIDEQIKQLEEIAARENDIEKALRASLKLMKQIS